MNLRVKCGCYALTLSSGLGSRVELGSPAAKPPLSSDLFQTLVPLLKHAAPHPRLVRRYTILSN